MKEIHMKKLVTLAMLSVACLVTADVVVDKATEITTTIQRPVTTMTSETKKVALPAGAKVVWTQFTIAYTPPAFTQAVYSVSYVIQDPVTKREITGTRNVAKMTEAEVVAFAATKGVDFTQMGGGIGMLLNEYLKTKVTPAK
jgi:hypothetical protein